MRELGDQVAAPDLERVEPETRSRTIHQPFDRCRNDRSRYAAIRSHWAGVAGDTAGTGAVLGYSVRPGHVRQRHQRLDPTSGWEIRIGADIAEDIGIDCQQSTVCSERAAQTKALVARVERGGQIFEPVLDPGHGAGKTPSRPDRHDVFRYERHLLAEAASDLGRDHAELGFR